MRSLVWKDAPPTGLSQAQVGIVPFAGPLGNLASTADRLEAYPTPLPGLKPVLSGGDPKLLRQFADEVIGIESF